MTESPTTDIEPIKPADSALGERMKYAQALAAASLLPKSYQRQPANVLLAMEYGHALGLDTITAIQSVHVINGKPSASAQLIGALVRRQGHRLRVTGDDKHAVAEIIRKDDPDFVFRSEWTMERARLASLTGKDTWKQYPAAMLKARAITEVARDACPEALAGVAYTPEELGDDGQVEWPAQNEIPQADEVTGEIIQTETDLPSFEADPVPEEQPPATPAQLKAIGAILNKCGAKDREQRIQIISLIVGYLVESSEELTKHQAHSVIDTLAPLADQADPIQALAEWLQNK